MSTTPQKEIVHILREQTFFRTILNFKTVRITLYILRAKKQETPPQIVYGYVCPDVLPASEQLQHEYRLKNIAPTTPGRPKQSLSRVHFRIPSREFYSVTQTLLTSGIKAALIEAQISWKSEASYVTEVTLEGAEADGLLYTCGRNHFYRRLTQAPNCRSLYENFSGISLIVRPAPQRETPPEVFHLIEKETRIPLTDDIEQQRIGALEFMAFPNLTPALTKRTYLSNKDGQLNLCVGAGDGGRTSLVRLESRPGVSWHYIVDLPSSRPTTVALLSDSQQLGAADLFVFQGQGSDPGNLLMQDHINYIRSIGFENQFITGTSSIQIDEIPSGLRRGPLAATITDLESRTDSIKTSGSVGEKSPLIPASQPTRSVKSWYFDVGWERQPTETSRLTFYAWLQRYMSENRNVHIQDPYFDVLGLSIIESASDSGTVTVHTCLSRDSEDDGIGGKRRIRVIDACRGLQARSVKLIDYPVNAFHDRFIWCTTATGGLGNAYQLSNSIQGASCIHPLVITPIETQSVAARISAHMTQLGQRHGSEVVWPPKLVRSLISVQNSRFCADCLASGSLSRDRNGRFSVTDSGALYACILRCIQDRWPTHEFWDAVETLSHVPGIELAELGSRLDTSDIEHVVNMLIQHDQDGVCALSPVPLDSIDRLSTFNSYYFSLTRWMRPGWMALVPVADRMVMGMLSSSFCMILRAIAVGGNEALRAKLSAALISSHFETRRSTYFSIPDAYPASIVRLWNPVMAMFALAYAVAKQALIDAIRCVEGVSSAELQLEAVSVIVSRFEQALEHSDCERRLISKITASAIARVHSDSASTYTETDYYDRFLLRVKSRNLFVDFLAHLRDRGSTSCAHEIFVRVLGQAKTQRALSYLCLQTRCCLAEAAAALGTEAKGYLIKLIRNFRNQATDIVVHLGAVLIWKDAWNGLILCCDIAERTLELCPDRDLEAELKRSLTYASEYPKSPFEEDLDNTLHGMYNKLVRRWT